MGQTVEFQAHYPRRPPFPSDFEVMIDGKEVKHKARTTPVTVNEKPHDRLAEPLDIKFDKPGKQETVIE